MNRTAFTSLWAFTFVIPWEGVIRFEGFGSIGRLVGAVALAGALLQVLVARGLRPLLWFHFFVLLFVLWSAITLLWTVDPDATRIRVLTYVQLAAFAWVIWELAPSRTRQLELLQAYVLGAYVLVASTLANYLTGVGTAGNSVRYAGLDYNPNELGFTAALGLPMAWYLAVARPHGLLTWVNRLYVPLGMGAVFLTASRGAFIPALAAVLLVPWTLPRLPLGAKVATGVVVIATLLFARHMTPDTSWERLATARTEIETGTLGGRLPIWTAGLEVFRQHPLEGVGAGAFAAAVSQVLGYPKAPHQTFLSVLVGQGTVGFLLFFALFVAAMLSLRRMASLERKFWLVMLLTLGIGLMPRTWDYRKPLWLVLSLLTSHTAVIQTTHLPPGRYPHKPKGSQAV